MSKIIFKVQSATSQIHFVQNHVSEKVYAESSNAEWGIIGLTIVRVEEKQNLNNLEKNRYRLCRV